MAFPLVVPRIGTSWRNRSAVTPRMKTASWAVSFVSVLSSRTREKATRVEIWVFSESCTLSDISSMRQWTVRDERLTLSKTERSSGQTESTTLLDEVSIREWLHPASKDAGRGKPHNWHAVSCRPQQFARGRTKLFSTGCLTIYRWRLSSPRKTSTQSLILDALPPSGGTS